MKVHACHKYDLEVNVLNDAIINRVHFNAPDLMSWYLDLNKSIYVLWIFGGWKDSIMTQTNIRHIFPPVKYNLCQLCHELESRKSGKYFGCKPQLKTHMRRGHSVGAVGRAPSQECGASARLEALGRRVGRKWSETACWGSSRLSWRRSSTGWWGGALLVSLDTRINCFFNHKGTLSSDVEEDET